MSANGILTGLVAASVALLAVAFVSVPRPGEVARGEWPAYAGDLGAKKYSAELVKSKDYGSLVAIDLNNGDILWKVANGNGPRDHPALVRFVETKLVALCDTERR